MKFAILATMAAAVANAQIVNPPRQTTAVVMDSRLMLQNLFGGCCLDGNCCRGVEFCCNSCDDSKGGCTCSQGGKCPGRLQNLIVVLNN